MGGITCIMSDERERGKKNFFWVSRGLVVLIVLWVSLPFITAGQHYKSSSTDVISQGALIVNESEQKHDTTCIEQEQPASETEKKLIGPGFWVVLVILAVAHGFVKGATKTLR